MKESSLEILDGWRLLVSKGSMLCIIRQNGDFIWVCSPDSPLCMRIYTLLYFYTSVSAWLYDAEKDRSHQIYDQSDLDTMLITLSLKNE